MKPISSIINFDANFKFIRKLKKEYVYFKKVYPINPQIILYCKRIPGDKPYPFFQISPYEINRERFCFYHEKYDKNKFKFYYEVIGSPMIPEIKSETFQV
jgi:hypothetical protein